MDLVVFAGFLVAAGYYINDGNFEGFQPRAILSRKALPANEVLGGDDNVYRSTMIERNEKYTQDRADEQWAAIQLRKLKTRGKLENLEGVETSGEREDDSFALYPFDAKPDFRAHHRGPNLDKLRQLKTEGFLPGADTAAISRDRPAETEWNGPQLPPLTGVDRSREQTLATASVSGTMNGVMMDGLVQDKPLMEHETRILPKQSDELRSEPLHNYSIDRVMPETVLYEAPTYMPKPNVKLNTVFETNGAFSMPSNTFGDAVKMRPAQLNRELKKDKTITSRGGPASGVERAPQKNTNSARMGVYNKHTYDSLNFARPSGRDATPLKRITKLPPTRRQELQNVRYVSLDGLPSGPVLRNTAIPRTTQRETINIDGRLAGQVTAPHSHPSYDISTAEIPGPTNKENNLIHRSGLPGVENAKSVPQVNRDLPPTLKDDVAMRSFAFTSPAGAAIGNMPVTGTSTKNSNAVRYFESRVSNPDIPSHAPPLLGSTDKKTSDAREVQWESPLDLSDRHDQFGNVEDVAETFAKYARQPTKFF